MQIKLCAISKIYKQQIALQSVTTVITTGDVIVLMGPNGAGKSTLLRILAGVYQPTNGVIKTSDYPVSSPAYRDRVGFLPQRPRFYDHLTPTQWLNYLARLKALPPNLIPARIERLQIELGWQEAASIPISKLSPGLRQRVALASAYLNDPDLVFLDEPFTNLDPQARLSILNWISTQISGRITVMTTHTLAGLENLVNRVWLLIDGRLTADLSFGDAQHIAVMEKSRIPTLDDIYVTLTGKISG